MARMIAKVPPDQIGNRGERRVFDALASGLGSQCTVFYRLPFLRKHPAGGNLVDGEIDFVVLDQELGVLLVLEVKEGVLECRHEAGVERWYQGGRAMDVDPWTQATGNKFSLLEFLAGRLGWDPHRFPMSHGHAVILADVSQAPPLAANQRVEAVIPGLPLETLGERVVASLLAWRRANLAVGEDQVESVRRNLMPEFVYGDRLADRIGLERVQLADSMEHVEDLVAFTGNYRRARIEGCAGSGKTVMAMTQARMLARQGVDVLVLAYNRAIVAYLKRHLDGVDRVRVLTFHEYAQDCCRRAGLQWPEPLPASFWQDEAPDLLDRALERLGERVGALIVDEAQDFGVGYWSALERAIDPAGWLYALSDPAQDIFRQGEAGPVSSPPFILRSNRRSTRQILEAVEKLTGRHIAGAAHLPEGAPVIRDLAVTPAQRRRLAGKVIHDWIRRGGLTENQLVVLGAHRLENTCAGEEGRLGSFRLVERGLPGPGTVPYFTYMAFKGCEADAVLLLDVNPTDDPRWATTGLYCAMTRARHLLALVEVPASSAAEPPPV